MCVSTEPTKCSAATIRTPPAPVPLRTVAAPGPLAVVGRVAFIGRLRMDNGEPHRSRYRSTRTLQTTAAARVTTARIRLAHLVASLRFTAVGRSLTATAPVVPVSAMLPSPLLEYDAQWEFDCPKWRDLRRANDEDGADSWFGATQPHSQHPTNTRTASTSIKQQQHQRAASAIHPPSECSSKQSSLHSRVKAASDGVLSLSLPSYCQSALYPVLPVRSVTPLTQPEPFKLTTERRASRAAPSTLHSHSTHRQQQSQPQPLTRTLPHQRSSVAAVTDKENTRSTASSQPTRPYSQSMKKQAAASSTCVADVVSQLYTHRPQPLNVRTNRSEAHGQSTTGPTSKAHKARTSRPMQVSGVRPSSRASVAASPAISPDASPTPTPSASSPLCSTRRITRPLPFRLASDVRAEQRRQWEVARLAVSAERSVTVAAAETEKAAAERRDRRQIRHSLVHQPLPMPAFDTVFVPEKSKHTLTAPASPKLRTKLRASVGVQRSRPQHTTHGQTARCSSRR